MGGEPTVFEILRSEQDPAADAALLAALEDADVATASAIVETLLTRNTRQALHGLVQSFHTLDEALKQMVLIEWERLFGILREAGQSRSDQVRLNVLEIIRRGCIYRAAYLVEGALRNRAASVRQAAAQTLTFLADELLRTAPVSGRDADVQDMTPEQLRERMGDLEQYAEDRRQLVAAIEAAVASFDVHLQPSIVEIALWFLDDMSPAFWSMLIAPGSRAAQVAVRCITPSMSPRLVPFAMAGLGYSEFRATVAKALASGTDPAFLEEWLRQGWRLVRPKVARGMASIKELGCAANHGWELMQLSVQSHRHMARWIACTGLQQADRIEMLRELERHGSRATSRASLWALVSMQDPRVTELLWSLDDPDDPEVGRIARRELARRCPKDLSVPELVSGAVRTDWDSLARDQEPITFARYWSRFDDMSEQERVSAGHEMLKATPLAASVLARKLNESECTDRVRALRIIGVLNLASPFEDRLYQLCHDPSSAVRSAAVAAVGQLGTAVSRRLLHNALGDQDTRVQANAVEAIAASGHESAVDELLAKLSSPDNRVQANAVKALLKLGVREAAETLLKMLRHDNRMHRISALWLVERMGLFTLAARVSGMADDDPDPSVRQRASALTSHLPAPAVKKNAGPAAPVPAPKEVAVR